MTNPVADAVTAERQRAADIHAACQMAGRPNKAAAFVAEGKTLSQVLATLQVPATLDKFVDRINARFAGSTGTNDVKARHVANTGAGSLDKHVAKVNARFSRVGRRS
jgi:hypothetical protein